MTVNAFFEKKPLASSVLPSYDLFVLPEPNPAPKPEEDYVTRQAIHQREYLAAWEAAPPEFKQQASKMGIQALPTAFNSMAMEFHDGFKTTAYTPDVARSIDSFCDTLVEILGGENEEIIRKVSAAYEVVMEREAESYRAILLNRVVFEMVRTEGQNLTAKVHALMHSIPTMAATNGFGSMRESARACNVSVEWLRKQRNEWCSQLGIPVPEEGKKSRAACVKYAENANQNHWKRQTCTRSNLSKLIL
jgi:hypothetical protein